MAWVVCSIVLAFSNAIQWLFTSPVKYQKVDNPDATWQTTWKDILRYIVIPLAIIAFFTMVCLLEQQSKYRYAANLESTNYKLNYNITLSEFRPDSEVKIIMIVVSSWTESGYLRRMDFRDTSVRLIPSNSEKISVAYRFVLGDSPSPKVQASMGQKILEESEKYGDIIIVPNSDLYSDLSRKVYKAFEWANKYDFNYIIKTNDDFFVRMDIISKELEENIPPIHNVANKNSALDYKLPLFPPFTAGALYILSRDIVSLVVTNAPRLFTRNEDQNLGVWLFPYNIKLIHDRRIQQADVCEDDMIAKHFSDSYEKDRSMREMYENIINNRRLCEGFKQRFCALCYPCWGRENHWRDWNFDCDDVKGITLLHQQKFALWDSKTPTKVFDEPLNITMGSKEDEWIIPGLLSQHSSIYSLTDRWYLLHWLCWTTDSSTFQERHYKTIELIWVHTPNAIVFVLTTTLPDDFFAVYKKQGYQIYVIKFNKGLLLDRQWFLGPNSKKWLQDWNRWENTQFFFSHITDYMRYLLLYKYGGMYMDMDALWIRAPPDTRIEFIGSDTSDVSLDLEWTLERGIYLAPGVMRFRKGPRAITTYVKEYRDALEKHGLTILPGKVLYPRGHLGISELLSPDLTADQKLYKIEKSSWNIHLFGKVTNSKVIEEGSVISSVMKKFSLNIPHAPAPLVGNGKPDFQNHRFSYPFALEGPEKYRFISTTTNKNVDYYAGSLDGNFQGLNVIFVRGGPAIASKSIIVAKAAQGKLSFSSNGGGWSETSITINNPKKKDVNAVLNTLIYRPSEELERAGGKDIINLEVTFGEHLDKLVIEVLIPAPDSLYDKYNEHL
ncbi:1991_t:CDS:2 [Acaulospora colombiana]|uniref:1991_t:CDS:1 n=1 Tax=Acaulospora colombiana TaxID=27376 RepID=A0ACA9KAD2_9GLOM|nr:1991_t:CDS:2 [Acaulospora colombiana]